MAPAKARNKASHEWRASQSFNGKGGNKDGADKTGSNSLVTAKTKAIPNGLPVLETELGDFP